MTVENLSPTTFFSLLTAYYFIMSLKQHQLTILFKALKKCTVVAFLISVSKNFVSTLSYQMRSDWDFYQDYSANKQS
jgi:hypothetical protein